MDQLNTYLHACVQTVCHIKSSDHGKGLFVDYAQVPEDGVVISVPQEYIITAKSVIQYAQLKEHELLKQFLSIDDKGAPTDPNKLADRKIIVRFLLYQMLLVRRGTPDNKFSRWLVNMPPLKDINLPFTWSNDALQHLESSSIYGATRAKMVVTERNYTGFFSHPTIGKDIMRFVAAGPNVDKVKVDHIITYNDWLLLESWISSRSVEIPVPKDGKVCVQCSNEIPQLDLNCPPVGMALVPFIDFANHSDDATARFERLDNSVVLVADTSQRAVQDKTGEITINYGPEKSSSEFLFNYGFIPESHEDARSISIFYQPDDPEYRSILDAHYDPTKDPNADDYDSSYEALIWFMNRPTHRMDIKGTGELWKDDFIYLLAIRPELEIATDDEAGNDYALYYNERKLELDNLEEFLKNEYPGSFSTEILPRADHIVKQFLFKCLQTIRDPNLDDVHLGDRLTLLEKRLLERVRSQIN